MKRATVLFLTIFLTTSVNAQHRQTFVDTDIANFWQAYDSVKTIKDSAEKSKVFQKLYIDKASQGLKDLMQVRNYSLADYIVSIDKHPQFWSSIRKNTLLAKTQHQAIESSIEKLRKIYPSLKPSSIFFSVGAFRSNGTIRGNHVLIGSEMALADKQTNISELPEGLHYYYTKYRPFEQLPLLCTHEYVHTQQKLPLDNLLCNTLYEGIAEFVSCLAVNKLSSLPSFAFAKQHEQKIKDMYVQDLFLMDRMYSWLWGTNRNELKERDLGYYVGYRICEEYYKKAKDKKKAVQQMIELDYNNDSTVEAFFDASGFFQQPLNVIYDAYEKSRPIITSIQPFENGSKTVKPGKTLITVHFSKPLNSHNTGIDFGPLGEEYCPRISIDKRGWAEDGKAWTFEADLQPNKRYQILISNNFRMQDGTRLKPHLIDITTAAQ